MNNYNRGWECPSSEGHIDTDLWDLQTLLSHQLKELIVPNSFLEHQSIIRRKGICFVMDNANSTAVYCFSNQRTCQHLLLNITEEKLSRALKPNVTVSVCNKWVDALSGFKSLPSQATLKQTALG